MAPLSKTSALQFLRTHSPMPDDARLTDALIDEYDEVRRFFLSHPDPDCIPLFLQSFGRWGGRGVYQLVPTLLRSYSVDELRSPLVAALSSPHDSVRYWACQVAQEVQIPETYAGLVSCLQDANVDTRTAAAGALSLLGDKRATQALALALKKAMDDEEKATLQDAIDALT